ncbi:MAG: GDYXXLXY domain-containing protein [Archangiaceae bacterium]|nr:GDYXXLXY domain-containing protein [Archangiaceae bacterium]
MTPTLATVLEALEREDAVPVGTRARATEVLRHLPAALPWYARAFTGWYGWVAAASFLAFVDRTSWRGASAVALGLSAVVAALVMRALRPRGFFAHLALPLALAGEVVAVGGVGALSHWQGVAEPLFMLGIELALLALYPDTLMRFLCTLGASSAVLRLWSQQLGFHPVDALLLVALAGALLLFHFRPHLELTRLKRHVVPVAYGLTFAAGALLLGASHRYAHLELGEPARLGVALIALVQVGTLLDGWRHRALAAVGVAALAALSFSAPGVLASVALLGAALHRREPKLVAISAVFAVLFYGHLYYSLEQTLLFKAALLMGNGLCFVLLWRLLGARQVDTARASLDRRVMAMALAGALLVVNGLIVQKERVLDVGEPMLVELAPVDPRSLMQGDFMRLGYRLPWSWEQHPSDGRVVMRVDPNHVASFVRFDDGRPLQPDERLLRYRRRNGGVRLGAEAFFFEEGRGPLYAQARYGELKVTRRGDSVLVGLRDADRQRLGRALR